MTTDNPASGGSYGTTSGSDEREARAVMERLMAYDLTAEIERLRAEEDWHDRDRNSRMLAKDVDFRVMLTVMRVGARLTEEDGDARVSIQMLDGGARLDVGADEQKLPPGALAVVDAGQPWALTASGDSAALLTFAWPREKARPEGTGAA